MRAPSLQRARLSRWWRLAWIAGALTVSLAVGHAAVAAAGGARRVQAGRIALANSWKAPQFVRADAAGRVFLLRADTLEVYPLTPKRTLGSPSRLERLAGDQEPFVRDAAMSPDGGDWLLLDASLGGRVRLFRAGKEKPLPDLGWRAAAVALGGGEPLVAVFPVGSREIKLVVRGDGKVVANAKEPPPLLLGLLGSEWQTLVRESYELASRDWHAADATMRLQRAVRLAADPKGGVWVADELGYHLRRFTPAGRQRSELTVGKGKPVIAERSGAELDKKLAEVRSATGQRVDPASVRFTAPRVLDGFAAARDGRLYLLVSDDRKGMEGHLALDRFDPQVPSLARLPVAGLDELAGRLSVAAGRDGLYVAAFSGEDGLWRLPWEALEAAEWQRVDEAKLDGEPLPVLN
ncbi:MAG TPA: hypothetical protein VHQ90_09870 [Thermoanaerobaculia bacterium]|nr:hypothetical protein [Thermoanaerobaculia bacterium]